MSRGRGQSSDRSHANGNGQSSGNDSPADLQIIQSHWWWLV